MTRTQNDFLNDSFCLHAKVPSPKIALSSQADAHMFIETWFYSNAAFIRRV